MGCESIAAYHAGQSDADRRICDLLRSEIDAALPDAKSKIWHAHPVWFLAGNPVVGYGKLKACVRLLFWSGQSLETPGLNPEARYKDPAEIDTGVLQNWLAEARATQWDYKNIVKRKGELTRLF